MFLGDGHIQQPGRLSYVYGSEGGEGGRADSGGGHSSVWQPDDARGREYQISKYPSNTLTLGSLWGSFCDKGHQCQTVDGLQSLKHGMI